MIVSGFTDNRLNDIKTYSKTSPYQVGVNGVTNIIYDTNNNIDSIDYVIDGISYRTFFPGSSDTGISYINDNTTLRRPGVQNLNESTRSRSFVPTDRFGRSAVVYKTIFYYTPGGCTEEDYNVLKEEVKIGVVFPPKIDEEVFIERANVPIFEPHSRMSEIGTLEELEDYRNGYYNIINT